MIPSYKHPAMEELLEKTYGRTSAIESNRCLPPPVGCGGLAEEYLNQPIMTLDQVKELHG